MNKADSIQQAIEMLREVDGITIDKCGKWLWIDGDTMSVRTELKAIGCRWDPKKGLWYWRDESQKRTRRFRSTPMDRIRMLHGDEKIM